MKKQFLKVISFFTVFVLLCCPVLHLFASALSSTAEVVSAKVDPEVMAAFADGAEVPEIYFYSEKPAIQNGYSDINREDFGGMLLRGEIRNCENLESCRIAVCFDPQVMEVNIEETARLEGYETEGFGYTGSTHSDALEVDGDVMIIEVYRLGDQTVQPMPAAVRTATETDSGTDAVVQLLPLQFHVFEGGETELSFRVLSWTDTDGNTIEGKITVDESVQYAMSAEDYIAMTTNPTCLQSSTIRGHWYAPDKLTVAQVKENAPDSAEVVILNAEQNRVLADDEYIATGCYYTVHKNGMQYFSTKLIVLNDLTGDGLASSEDARLALRFAVGLDTATDDQRYAAELVGDGEFTSALARDILRAAVGLSA